MKAHTNQLLLKLGKLRLFSECMQPFESDPAVQRLSNWADAIKSCGSQTSKDARLAAQNTLTRQLSMHHREAYHAWNPLVKEIRPAVDKIIETKLTDPAVRAILPNGAIDEIRPVIRYSWLGICMAHEYDELIPISRFYELTEHFYVNGHFPCGWVGEAPDSIEAAFVDGKLAVL